MKLRHILLLVLCVAVATLSGCNRVHYPINLNSGSERDLEELPDIGPKHAAAIIAGRPHTISPNKPGERCAAWKSSPRL